MRVRGHGEQFDAIVSITDAFDPIAASKLRARLSVMSPDACVLLDLSRALEVADLALAVLADALATAPHPRVLVRGLTQHQERLLRYLGVAEIVADAPDREDPPEQVGDP